MGLDTVTSKGHAKCNLDTNSEIYVPKISIMFFLGVGSLHARNLTTQNLESPVHKILNTRMQTLASLRPNPSMGTILGYISPLYRLKHQLSERHQ